MKISAIALIFMVLFSPMVQADDYEVLVVDIAAAGDTLKIAEFENDARQFNDLHRRGYPRAKPYFNLLRMANGQIYFVFGFRDEVQGVHRHHYPGTVENLQGLTKNGKPKYPDMHWLSAAEIRKMLAGQ
jgi:hypothetical protein